MGYIFLLYSQASFITRYCANYATLKHYALVETKSNPRIAIIALIYILFYSIKGFFSCLDNDILYSKTY
jgi:membrane associated rhomboid family serine protease